MTNQSKEPRYKVIRKALARINEPKERKAALAAFDAMLAQETENRSHLRRMIAERGIDDVLEDLSGVCKDIAGNTKSPKYMNMWYDRAFELKALADQYEVSRRRLS